MTDQTDANVGEFELLRRRVKAFVDERDWEQFHSPKNLSMAMIVEAGELVEIFQWLTERQSESPEPQRMRQIEEEMADVLVYLIRLADRLNVDLYEAANRKIAQNEAKYPADKVRGSSKKYQEYEN